MKRRNFQVRQDSLSQQNILALYWLVSGECGQIPARNRSRFIERGETAMGGFSDIPPKVQKESPFREPGFLCEQVSDPEREL